VGAREILSECLFFFSASIFCVAMKRVSQNAETLKYVDKATQTPICLEAQTQTPGEWQDDGLSLEAAKYLTYVDTSKKDASIEWDSTRQMQAAVDMWMMDHIKRNGVKSDKGYGNRPKVEQFTKEWMSFTGERPHPFVVELFKWARQEHWSRKRDVSKGRGVTHLLMRALWSMVWGHRGYNSFQMSAMGGSAQVHCREDMCQQNWQT
jgi:hypothetical protein